MKTELTDISSVRKILKIEISADIMQQARQSSVSEVQKKAKLPGFRAGKIPPNILEQRFGPEIDKQSVENAIDLTLVKALQEVKVRPISRPEITPGMHTPQGGFTYTASFEVLPKIELKETKGFKLTKEEPTVSKEEIDAELKRLQTTMTQLEPVSKETIVAEGHVIQMSFKGSVEGKPFEGGTSRDHATEIGSGQMLAEFEKGIKGTKAGETKEISFQYPKDYFNKDLAGKKAEFSVTVKEIRKKYVPKLDDNFAKDLGNYKTMKEVEEDLKKRILEYKEHQQKDNLCNQIVEELIKKNKFDVPESLIQSELRFMLERFAQELQRRGQKIEEMPQKEREELVEKFRPEAERRVRGFLLLAEVAQQEKCEVSPKEVDERMAIAAKQMGRPLKEIKDHYEKNNLLGSLQTQILNEKALDIVLKQAKIKVVKPKKEKKS